MRYTVLTCEKAYALWPFIITFSNLLEQPLLLISSLNPALPDQLSRVSFTIYQIIFNMFCQIECSESTIRNIVLK